MGMILESFNIPEKRQAISTDDFTVKIGPWKSGNVLVIDSVAVSNQTTGTKVVHIGISRGTISMYMATLNLTTIGHYYTTYNRIITTSDNYVVVKIVSPTAGDIYHINVMAHLEPIAKEM